MYAHPSDLKLSDDIERRLAQQQFDDLSFRGSERADRLYRLVAGGALFIVVAMLLIAKIG